MESITVLIPTKNDDDVIADAITSAKMLTNNIVVVDGNNDNKTQEISEKLGAKVVKHHFKDFSDQRNYAILNSSTPWVLYLDSDERLTNEFCIEVNKILNNYDEYDPIGGYYIKRKTFYYGKDWGLTDKVQRLFYRKKFIEWRGVVHETPEIKGNFGSISSPILHFTHRNMSQMVQKTNEWSDFEANLRFESKHPKLAVWRFLRVMLTEFLRSYFKNNGYKNGVYGLIESMYQSFSIFITYSKLWEKQISVKTK